MLRSIIAVTAGVLAGVTIVIFGAFIVTQMTPDLSGLKSLPIANKFGVIGVWFVGAFFGAGLSSLIGRRWAPASWVVAATMALFAVSNFAADPAPLWMMALTVAGIAAGGWSAVRTTAARYGAPPAAKKPGL